MMDLPSTFTITYNPYGGCRELIASREDEVLVSGAAGTGKSLAALFKLLWIATEYPGSRCLIVRKTRESLTESALVTFEKQVLPDDKITSGISRENRQSYKFDNGSEIVVGGLRQSHRDNSQKIMSTEYDVAYVQEATELSEEEWEKITTRLRNRKVPFQQLIADTNPSSPNHWLKKRCDRGVTQYIQSRHEDNPTLWNGREWTEWGKKYIAKLDRLTGARKLRLRYGRWAQAEGVVYDNWDTSIHVIDRFKIPYDWRRILSVDFGFTNPIVLQWWAIDGDGRMFLYREYVKVGMLVEDAAKVILSLTKTGPDPTVDEPFPSTILCDHDEEDRATLERHLKKATKPARKDVKTGIQEVTSRLSIAKDGRARMFVFRDALVNRDAQMEEDGLPIGLIEEMDGYVWREDSATGPREEPLKMNDHSEDCCRYCCKELAAGGQLIVPKKKIVLPEPKPMSNNAGGLFGLGGKKWGFGIDGRRE